MLNFSSDLLILISLLKSCEAASAPDCTIGSNKQLQAINGLTEIQNEKKKKKKKKIRTAPQIHNIRFISE